MRHEKVKFMFSSCNTGAEINIDSTYDMFASKSSSKKMKSAENLELENKDSDDEGENDEVETKKVKPENEMTVEEEEYEEAKVLLLYHLFIKIFSIYIMRYKSA
jgi:hypothetical protein